MDCILLSFVLCVDLPAFVPYCFKKRKKKTATKKDVLPGLSHEIKLEFL